MTVQQIVQDIGSQQGWSRGTMLELCLEYIENQKCPDAFRDFLLEKQRREEDLMEELRGADYRCNPCGGIVTFDGTKPAMEPQKGRVST